LRLSPALARLDPQPIELGIPDGSSPASAGYDMNAHAASSGGEFMVAMMHFSSQTAYQTVVLRRVLADGSISAGVQGLTQGVPLDIVADRDRYAVAIASPMPVDPFDLV